MRSVNRWLLSCFLIAAAVGFAALSARSEPDGPGARALPITIDENGARWVGRELLPPLPQDPEKRAATLRRVQELNPSLVRGEPATVTESLTLRTPPRISPTRVPNPHPTRPLRGPLGTNATTATGPLISLDGFDYTVWGPKGADIAAGPNHVLIAADSLFAVYDKCGNWLDGGGISSYFPVPSTFTFNQPRVLFDDWDNRWVMTFVGDTFAGSAFLFIFVSNTNNPLDGWYFYAVQPGLTTEFPADVQVSVDPTLFIVTADLYAYPSLFFQTASIWWVDKSDLYSESALSSFSFSAFSHLPNFEPALGIRTAQSRSYDGNVYFLSTHNEGSVEYNLRKLLDPLGSPSITNSIVPVTPYSRPPNIQQPNLTYVETGDARITDLIFYSGHLYAARNVDSGGSATAIVDKVSVSSLNVPSGVFKANAAYGALDIDHTGVLTWSWLEMDDTSLFPSIYYRSYSTGNGALLGSGLLQEGLANFAVGGVGTDTVPFDVVRYFGVAVDPSDHRTMWIHGLYATDDPSGAWTTRFGATTVHDESALTATLQPPGYIVGPPGGPFSTDHFTLRLDNTGGVTANWTIDGLLSWMNPSATSGQITPGGSVEVKLFLNQSAYELPPSLHQTSSLRFTNCTGSDSNTLVVSFGIADSLDCYASLIDFRPQAASTGTDGILDGGLFITPIQDIDLCAIGVEAQFAIPQSIFALVYEATGTIRGTLLATQVTVVIDSAMTTHFFPIDVQLAACQDYEIVLVSTSGTPLWKIWEPILTGVSAPFDVGGVIRVNSPSLGGSPGDLVPGMQIIASSGCDNLVDLDPGGGASSSSTVSEVGMFVVPDRDARTCAVGLEADLPVGSIAAARVHESASQVRGALIGLGSVLVSSSGLMVHDIQINASLLGGQEYEVVINFDGPATWNFYSAATPYTVSPFDVVAGQIGGVPGNDVPHLVIRWSDLIDRDPLNLIKPDDIFPPPLAGAPGSIDQGAALSFGSDDHVFAFGWSADIPPGQVLTASVYDYGAAGRGDLLSEGTSVSQGSGEQWHDVPIAFNPAASDLYIVAFSCPSVSGYGYWDATTGLPYSAGFVTVQESESDELLYMRTYTCDLQQVGVGDLPRPLILTLMPPSPNPASGIVSLAYSLAKASTADMAIFDVQGRKVADLFRDRHVEAGEGFVNFDVSRLSSGIYFVKLTTSTHSLTRKLVVTD